MQTPWLTDLVAALFTLIKLTSLARPTRYGFPAALSLITMRLYFILTVLVLDFLNRGVLLRLRLHFLRGWLLNPWLIKRVTGKLCSGSVLISILIAILGHQITLHVQLILILERVFISLALQKIPRPMYQQTLQHRRTVTRKGKRTFLMVSCYLWSASLGWFGLSVNTDYGVLFFYLFFYFGVALF